MNAEPPPPPTATKPVEMSALESGAAATPNDFHSNNLVAFHLKDLPDVVAKELAFLDVDQSGDVDVTEVRLAANAFHAAKNAAKWYKVCLIAALAVLAIFMLLFFGVVFSAIQYAKEANIGLGGVMTVKGTNTAVQTANSEFYIGTDGSVRARTLSPAATDGSTPATGSRMLFLDEAHSDSPDADAIKTSVAVVKAPLSSEHPDTAFQEMSSVTLISLTGATAQLKILGFVRHATSEPMCCSCTLPDVTLITHVGRVTLSGDTLYYFDDPSTDNGFHFFFRYNFTNAETKGRRVQEAGSRRLGSTTPYHTREYHYTGARRVQVRALFALFNAVVAASKLGPFQIKGKCGAEFIDPPSISENFIMFARRRVPCVPNMANTTVPSPVTPTYNGSIPFGDGMDVCASLLVPDAHLTSATRTLSPEVKYTERYLPLSLTIFRIGSKYLRTEYTHPMHPDTMFVEVLDNSKATDPLQFEYQVMDPSGDRGYTLEPPNIANELPSWKNDKRSVTSPTPLLTLPVAYFNLINVSADDLMAESLGGAMTYMGNTNIGDVPVRLWAFDILSGEMKAFWYDTVSKPHTVMRISLGQFGDMDVFDVQELGDDAEPAFWHLFQAPSSDITTFLDQPMNDYNNSEWNNADVQNPTSIPARITRNPWAPYRDEFIRQHPGEVQRRMRRQMRADSKRRQLSLQAEARALGIRDESRSLAVTLCPVDKVCEAVANVFCGKKCKPSDFASNTFSISAFGLGVTLGPLTGKPCLYQVSYDGPLVVFPILTIGAAVTVQLGRDFSCFDKVEGELRLQIDPLYEVLDKAPEAVKSMNPFVYNIASLTLGVYNSNLFNFIAPTCSIKDGLLVTPIDGSEQLLKDLVLHTGVATAQLICDCLNERKAVVILGASIKLPDIPGPLIGAFAAALQGPEPVGWQK